ncbi:permease-like cell division protein FtsX [Nonomuraea rhodomycinica]|uniref:FtsX extracellular domain-containing protein n=1 Tax=Nonomuraea rhodomycinica TaxID=1712872 RepID=A0A7Y6MEF5_9ACTN|nr:permease-like cell division protein FtsX [Nonomuraea rhodomycinica]NUW43654.1 hypothetical protein [Nonomuraea rhodomycinica]
MVNSVVKHHLHEGLSEADGGALRRLEVLGGRWRRVATRLAVAATAVWVLGVGTAGSVAASSAGEGAAAAPWTQTLRRADVSVFLCTGREERDDFCHGRPTGERQKRTLAVSLRKVPGVAKVTFEDRKAAYKRFRKAFADQPDIVAKVRPEDVPESYQITVRKGTKLAKVVGAAKRMPGVALVSDRTMTGGYDLTDDKNTDHVVVFLCGASSLASSSACEKYEKSKTSKRGKGITAEDRDALEREIKAMPEVKKVHFEDQAEAYASFREAYADNKALLSATRKSDMPESFRIRLKSDADSPRVAAVLGERPGVAQAMDVRCFSLNTKLYVGHGISSDLCG